MPFAPGREKALPDTPIDIDARMTEAEDRGPCSPKSATFVNTNKALPSIKAENVLSEEEMGRLHELWNGAGLSARAHRRRRGHNPSPRRIPAPITIPEPGNIPPPPTASDPSIMSATPSTAGTRKRWGFFTSRPFSETQEVERKISHALGTLRTMAQGRLRRKLRYAKSAPNLGDQGAASQRSAMPPPVTTPTDAQASTPPSSTSPGELAVLQPEDMDSDAIYFTIDALRGSLRFRFITPVPDTPTSLERPDSPLMHRHFSLDQLSFARQAAVRGSMALEFPGDNPSDEVLHLIDELHAYLEVEL